MTSPFLRLVIVGCGRMGQALLGGWKTAGILPTQLTIIDPDLAKANAAARTFGGSAHESTATLTSGFRPECVVFAVKPQTIDAVLPYYTDMLDADNLAVSIVAGKTLAYFDGMLGNVPMIRAMPNTPALIGKGMTVMVANAHTTAALRKKAETLMGAVGKTEWLADEALVDAATAVSGSGPAYVFLFLEALTEAGIQAGLDKTLARTLALQTVMGSAALAENSAEPFDLLRRNVTSPGGTTEAALHVLMGKSGMKELIYHAVENAAVRSRQLSKATPGS